MYYKKFVALLLAVKLLAVLLYGCIPSNYYVTQPAATNIPVTTTTEPSLPFDPEALLHEVTEEAIEDIYNYRGYYAGIGNVEDLTLRVFGVFGDTYVLMIDGGAQHAQIPYQETVNGLLFYYQTGQTLMVYKEKMGVRHPVSDLTEAFVLGYITAEQVEIIYENYYSAYPHLRAQAESVEKFTDEIRNQINAAWLDRYGEELDWSEKNELNWYRTQHYGSVGGKQIFLRTALEPRVIAAIAQIHVGQYVFEHHYDFEIYVFEAGDLLTLAEAYEQGRVSDTEVQAIYDYHNWGY